ncbi:hypothetical protein BD770DRAFT_423320 [Pilaira anomala]|nr:hypothetical protein BD770DRAFT_423320 [Pilaira anomala]
MKARPLIHSSLHTAAAMGLLADHDVCSTSAPKLVESVAIIENTWFLMTSFSVFRFGYVEVLATGGSFFGSVDSGFSVPFLGSFIRGLPDRITSNYQVTLTDLIFAKDLKMMAFSPVNPLSFISPTNIMHSSASLVGSSFAIVEKAREKRVFPRYIICFLPKKRLREYLQGIVMFCFF